MAASKPITLDARLSPSLLELTATNHTRDPVVMVALPRYFLVEIEDALSQFVRVSTQDGALPTAADYRSIAPGERVTVLALAIHRTGSTVTIADRTVDDVAPLARVRVTYKADRVMPNLPKSKQRYFYLGPTDASSEPIPDDQVKST